MKTDSWQNNSVGKILEMQTWEPEINPHHPNKNQSMMVQVCKSSAKVTELCKSLDLPVMQSSPFCEFQVSEFQVSQKQNEHHLRKNIRDYLLLPQHPLCDHAQR